MISLVLNTPHVYKTGEVVHLKIGRYYEQAPGKWRLEARDVTPLSGAEPTGYGCHICGIIKEAKPDGSLPDGWIEAKYEEGNSFVCPECKGAAICRICGCTDEHGCIVEGGEGEDIISTCYWAEPNLCSACALKLVRNSNQKEQ